MFPYDLGMISAREVAEERRTQRLQRSGLAIFSQVDEVSTAPLPQMAGEELPRHFRCATGPDMSTAIDLVEYHRRARSAC